jgi:hypothetical protein
MRNQTPILALAAAYIEHGFTKNAFARNAEGVSIDSVSPEAESWCLLGALNAAIANRPIGGLVLLDVLSDIVGGNLVTFNDSASGPEEILLALSEAASRE